MTRRATWQKQRRDQLDCLECEKTVNRSREDQKFCSDLCRWTHNRRNSYRDHTTRLTFAKWLSFIGPEDQKPLSKAEFFKKLRSQLEKIPDWT